MFVKAPAGGLPAGLRTGARVTVTGAWLGAAGGAAPAPRAAADAAEAAGAPRNTGSFAATAITVTATPPTGEARHSIAPAQLAGGAAADAAADAAAAAAAALPLSSNELLTAELSTLIIPSEPPQAEAAQGRAFAEVGMRPRYWRRRPGAHLTYPSAPLPPWRPAVVAKTPSGGACPGTQLPNFTADQVRRAVFEEQNAGGVTVGGTFNRCSHGKTRLTAANSAVVEPVELPCSGTR